MADALALAHDRRRGLQLYEEEATFEDLPERALDQGRVPESIAKAHHESIASHAFLHVLRMVS